MRQFVILTIAAFAASAAAQEPSAYAGQEGNSIRSLSEGEIRALRNGEGMGFARLAELNHYPGPRHVLDLAAELGLSEAQIRETEAVFAEMRRSAVALGEELIHAERRLDARFANGDIDPESLSAALSETGALRARLRYVHVAAHLEQRALLTDRQIHTYDRLRGYGDGSHENRDHSGHHE